MRLKKIFRENGLSIAFISFTVITLFGQSVMGWKEHNDELLKQGIDSKLYSDYLLSGHFIQATFENWESEFFQMGLYVFLTVFLKQKGSSESKKIDEVEDVDRLPQPSATAPWPVNKGGWILDLYKYSLSLIFLILFLISFLLHASGTHIELREIEHQDISYWETFGTSRFWFESFQNWQSEFLSVASIVFLSIYLRQIGSPESKAVDAPHSETGR